MTIAAPDYQRLADFCVEARALMREARPLRISEHRSWAVPNAATLNKILPNLSNLLMRARSNGDGFNPWSVAGLRKSELRNAGVLASLWNPQECGDRAIEFLDRFLRLIPVPSGQKTLPSRTNLDRGYQVRTEHSPIPGERSERLDITIEGAKFLLIVEIKIKAGESGDSQFDRYEWTAQNWSRLRGKPVSFILLAPFKPNNFLHFHATWRDVEAAAKAGLPRRQIDHTFHTQLLANFARHIRDF